MKLTQDAKVWWKLWSVRLQAIGLLVTGWLTAVPDAVLFAWNAMPPDMKAFLPPQYMPFIGLAILTLGILVRFIKQEKLSKEVNAPYR